MPVTNRESPMAATLHNRLAAEYIRKKRDQMAMNQAEFALVLSDVVGLTVSPFSLCYYEAGKHTIPAAVLLAAQSIKPPRRRKHVVSD